MKNIMTRAWEIAREAVKNFGGKAVEYIAGALKQAWAEVKEDIQLEGTEKQIAWAEDIRNAYIEKVAAYYELREEEVKITGKVTTEEIIIGVARTRRMVEREYNQLARKTRKTMEKAERRTFLKEENAKNKAKIEKAIQRKINATLNQTDASFWINNYKGLTR